MPVRRGLVRTVTRWDVSARSSSFRHRADLGRNVASPDSPDIQPNLGRDEPSRAGVPVARDAKAPLTSGDPNPVLAGESSFALQLEY